MKTEKNSEYTQLLLEKSSFKDLSEIDKAHVLKTMSAQEYEDSRSTILAAGALFSEADVHEPKPLLLVNRQSVLMAPIPLYQMLIGIAAIALLMLLVIPIKKIGVAEQTIRYVTMNDTIIQEVVRYDTIETIIEKPVIRERIVYVAEEKQTNIPEEAPRLLNVPRQNQDVSFSQNSLQNKGISLKDDGLMVSLPRIY